VSKRKLFSILMAIMLVATIGLTGCGGEEATEAPTPEEPAQEEKVLRVAFGMGETEWAVFNSEILPAFYEETGIKVEAIELKSDDLVNSLTAQVESGNIEIDMFAQDVNNLSGLVSRDLVEDLSAYKDRIPETVIPGMMEVSEYDGKLLFLPYRPNVEIAFYNDAKFTEYGVEPPKTWDELLTVAKTLKDETGQGRVAMKGNLQGDNVLHIFDFIKSAGGDPYVLNDKGSVEAFTFLQELWPYLSEQSTTANWDKMNKYLEDDSVYLGQNWPFYIPEFHKNGKDEIKAYSGWSGPVKESHALGGEVIGIPKGSQKVDEAMLFAEYLMSKEVQEVLVSELAWPSVRSDAYGLVQGYQEEYFVAIKEALDHAEPRGNVSYWEKAEPIYIEAFQRVVINGEEVQPTLDELAQKLEDARNQ